MSDGPIVEVSKAVTTLLSAAASAGKFSQSFTPKRTYFPQDESKLSKLKDLTVLVSPGDMVTERGRMLLLERPQVAVFVGKYIGKDDITLADEMLGLVNQIKNYLFANPLAMEDEPCALESLPSPVYGPNVLEDMGVFASVYLFTYPVDTELDEDA